MLREVVRDPDWDPDAAGTFPTWTPEDDYRPDVRDPVGPRDDSDAIEQLRSLGYVQ